MTTDPGRQHLQITTKPGALSVDDTVEHLRALLTARHLTLFAVIDQRAEARRVGLDLRETVLVIFGSPVVGTDHGRRTIGCTRPSPQDPRLGGRSDTKISYLAPDALAERHQLEGGLAAGLRAIDALTDALSASAT